MLRVTVSPSSMLSRSTQARVSARAGVQGRSKAISTNGSSQPVRGGKQVDVMAMRSTLPGATAQVFAAEARAQQGAGIVGYAAQPGGICALSFFVGGRFGLRPRFDAGFGRAGALARSAGVDGALRRLSLRVVGGLLAGKGVGVVGVGRRRILAPGFAPGGIMRRGIRGVGA